MKLTTKQSLAILALVSPTTVTASPVPEPGLGNIINTVECIVVDVVVKALHAYPSASPFCSSFIHIPTITQSKTVTVTSPTTTVLPTTTGTNTITPVVTSTATDTVTSAAISTACSCLGIPTPTTTVTSTVTLKPTVTSYSPVAATATAAASTSVVTVTATKTVDYCPAPTLCGNQGLQWEYLPNTSGPNADTTYSNFIPQAYKGRSPTYTGVTSSIGGINSPGGQYLTIYGSSQTLYTSNFILNHRGYIYAQQTGTYTFSISGVDDAVYIWVGPFAYSGWLAANANTRVTYDLTHGHPGTGTFTINLSEGQYYPVRVIFAQGGGPAVFQLSVAAPDGTTFLSASTAGSPYLVQYSCDGTTAPVYPAWTAET
ncbi:hypothetical protein PT974_04469 [Cladobotryum mycophilum]|uniref:PA14 domain-containing protein n=1 Tax=Cladobotryum mycophilum TaxID=491253 RepID=A0ABR0SV71_9HYPO